MLNQTKSKRSEGFTIIEVMIVLAIAGLILLIVFLAIPALQRSSRNTSRKNDVAAILSSVSEYIDNNNGSLPTTAGDGTFNTAFVNANPKLGYYTDPSKITWKYQTTATAPTDPKDLDKVVVVNYATCNGSAADTKSASLRTVVALYDIEGSGGLVAQCQQT